MIKRYLIKREKQGIDLIPAYKRIAFIGSDAGNDSFKEGKGFHNLTDVISWEDLPALGHDYLLRNKEISSEEIESSLEEEN